jgi:hypothetical protein
MAWCLVKHKNSFTFTLTLHCSNLDYEEAVDALYWSLHYQRSENLKERDHSEDVGVDGSIILKRVLEKQDGKGGGWMHLAQDTDKWTR